MKLSTVLFSLLFIVTGCSVELEDGEMSFPDVEVGCSNQVPQGALVVRDGDEAELVNAQQAVLVCPGGVLVSHGGETRVWVLDSGEANINGGFSEVAATGAATVVVNADDVRVFEDGSISLTENGQDTLVTTCDSVEIDTSRTEGC